MTAQQQLAELLANDPDEMFDQTYRYVHFIREHGPAMVGLIEACKEFVEDNELLSHARIAAALRKLTQD